MTALAHVFAVEVEPGRYYARDDWYATVEPDMLYADRDRAERYAKMWRNPGVYKGYPSARVVEFALVEVKEQA